jgi:hypothetical protein
VGKERGDQSHSGQEQTNTRNQAAIG